jgi:hypothetical protein
MAVVTVADLKEDTTVYPTMVTLAGCLCTELAAAGGPTPCFCGLVPGGEVAIDCGCDDPQCNGNGMAWVRLAQVFPSSQFPFPDSTAATCATTLAYVLEVGVSRCVPVGDDAGNPPSLDEQLATVRLQTSDMQAMRRAIQCCVATKDTSYVLGNYQPMNSSGGCGGGVWTVTIWQV